jgi:hypothetical protein
MEAQAVAVAPTRITDFTGFEDVKGDTDYKINMTTGTLCNKRGKILGAKQNAGYILVNLPGKKMLLHRLIYIQRHGAVPAGRVIDHIDGNKLNNAISNLQAITNSENIKKAYADKDLTGQVRPAQKIIATNLETKIETTYPSLRQAQVKLGVANSSVRYCLDGKCKTALSKIDGKRYSFKAAPATPPSTEALASVSSSLALPV